MTNAIVFCKYILIFYKSENVEFCILRVETHSQNLAQKIILNFAKFSSIIYYVN